MESSRNNKRDSILQDLDLEPLSIPLADLKRITDNFSDERLLGVGGFGKVYKGVLENGIMIAVKKLMSSAIHKREFLNEAHHLMRLNHPNIVQLVGYCSETATILAEYNGKFVNAEQSEKLLCLEYLPNGSLRSYISGASTGLGWDTRYKIIKGVCNGLCYLHEEGQVVHMDLKPANILLDDNMMPKIADFGISRLFGVEKTRTCTASRDGTLGYMAPEYITRGLITKKFDIFSLGVIILEIVTGHRDYPEEDQTLSQDFIVTVLQNWRNRLKRETRSSLKIECYQIRKCIHIGLDCVKHHREKRPTINQIIAMLQGEDQQHQQELVKELARLQGENARVELVKELARLQAQNTRVAVCAADIASRYQRKEQENTVLRARAAKLRDRLRSANDVLRGVAMDIRNELPANCPLLRPLQLPCPSAQ